MRGRSPAIVVAFALAVLGAMSSALGAEPLDSSCSAAADKRAEPGVVLIGETLEVILDLALHCATPPLPVDVVLMLDRSDSMSGPTLVDAKRAALQFLDVVDYGRTRVGLVSFARNATTDARLGSPDRQLRSAVNRLVADGDTHIAEGLREAGRMLDLASPIPSAARVVVLLTDGQDSVGAAAVRSQAALRRAAGVRLVTVALGLKADVALLREIASEPSDAWVAPRSAELAQIYQRIAGQLMALRLRSLVVSDELPLDMVLVPGSTDPPAEVVGRTLQWKAEGAVGTAFRARYRLQPQRLGWRPTNVRAAARYVDSAGGMGEVEFPVPVVHVVSVLPSPTVPPTSPPAGPSPSTTSTAPPSATVPPLPVRTPRALVPRLRHALTVPAYLPHVSARTCRQVRDPVDVVLVLDTSTTMTERTAGGQRKLDLAIAAASAFNGDLDPLRDRVGVVAFSASAWIVQPLSPISSATQDALLQLLASRGSRLDLGLATARSLLAVESRVPVADRYVILLTDGQPVGASEDEVRREAARVRDSGAALIAVALGPGANVVLLRDIAGRPDRYLDAGSGERLERVYRDLAATLRCRP